MHRKPRYSFPISQNQMKELGRGETVTVFVPEFLSLSQNEKVRVSSGASTFYVQVTRVEMSGGKDAEATLHKI